MDFLLLRGIRKMPKIPDKSKFYFFPTKKKSSRIFFINPKGILENSQFMLFRYLNTIELKINKSYN